MMTLAFAVPSRKAPVYRRLLTFQSMQPRKAGKSLSQQRLGRHAKLLLEGAVKVGEIVEPEIQCRICYA